MKGQSTVEMAIITPILIFFMLGILEVGVAIRNYLTLVNSNREATRFAVRPNYLDLDAESAEGVGYDEVFIRAYDAAGQQGNFVSNTSMVINVIGIDTGYPCDPAERQVAYYRLDEPDGEWIGIDKSQVIYDDNEWPKFKADHWANCDCDLVATNPYTPPIIINALNNPNYGWSLPPEQQSRIDIQSLSKELASENDVHNCQAMKKTDAILPSQQSLVIVEQWYSHHQFFGVPFISNKLTDPIQMYTHTVMRLTTTRKSPFGNNH